MSAPAMPLSSTWTTRRSGYWRTSTEIALAVECLAAFVTASETTK
ncbi:hypothetical protein ACFV6Z_25355 [Streptomyces sp. NPDC059818]